MQGRRQKPHLRIDADVTDGKIIVGVITGNFLCIKFCCKEFSHLPGRELLTFSAYSNIYYVSQGSVHMTSNDFLLFSSSNFSRLNVYACISRIRGILCSCLRQNTPTFILVCCIKLQFSHRFSLFFLRVDKECPQSCTQENIIIRGIIKENVWSVIRKSTLY